MGDGWKSCLVRVVLFLQLFLRIHSRGLSRCVTFLRNFVAGMRCEDVSVALQTQLEILK